MVSLAEHICSECGGVGAVRESRRCSNGTRRRRLHCQSCSNRWTLFDGEPPGRCGHQHRTYGPILNAAQVRRILLASGSIAAISRETGHCRQTVTAILRGESHAHLCPDLPRRGSQSCLDCKHWQGCCGLGFPDPEEEGPGFASDCSSFCGRRAIEWVGGGALTPRPLTNLRRQADGSEITRARRDGLAGAV